MNEQHPTPGDNSHATDETLAARIQAIAAALVYPPTPDIASAITQRLPARSQQPPRWRWAWGLLVMLFVLGGLLAVPAVRAGVVRVLEIGVVRIFIGEPPTPVPLSAPTAAPAGADIQPSSAPPTIPAATPVPPLEWLLSLAGETTLADAQARAPFDIRLPGYPPDLGPPDQVFLQTLDSATAPTRALSVLVWLDPTQPNRPVLSIYQISEGYLVDKTTSMIRETTVNGRRAFWAEESHIINLSTGEHDLVRVVDGNVLIWQAGDGNAAITYRIETALPLEEALRIAESLE